MKNTTTKHHNIQRLRRDTEWIFFFTAGMTIASAFISWGTCMAMIFLTLAAIWGVVLTHEELQD